MARKCGEEIATIIWIPIVEIKSNPCLISIMGIPLSVKQHIFIESGPWLQSDKLSLTSISVYLVPGINRVIDRDPDGLHLSFNLGNTSVDSAWNWKSHTPQNDRKLSQNNMRYLNIVCCKLSNQY